MVGIVGFFRAKEAQNCEDISISSNEIYVQPVKK